MSGKRVGTDDDEVAVLGAQARDQIDELLVGHRDVHRERTTRPGISARV